MKEYYRIYIDGNIIIYSRKLNKNPVQRNPIKKDRRKRNVSWNSLLRIIKDLLFGIDSEIILHKRKLNKNMWQRNPIKKERRNRNVSCYTLQWIKKNIFFDLKQDPDNRKHYQKEIKRNLFSKNFHYCKWRNPCFESVFWHLSENKEQNIPKKYRNPCRRSFIRLFIKIYFHFKVLFSQWIRAYSCFRAEKKAWYIWFVLAKRLLLHPL